MEGHWVTYNVTVLYATIPSITYCTINAILAGRLMCGRRKGGREGRGHLTLA